MSEKQPRLPHLLWLRSFEAAARLQNFTAAARELGLTQAAISQHVALLEAHLGEQLFERGRRGVALTGAGAGFLPHVQSAFGAIERSTGDLFGRRTSSRLTIRSPISFAQLWLAPRLAALSNALPQLSLDIRTVHLPADLADEDADFDIRFGMGSFAARGALRLTRESLLPVAAQPSPDLDEAIARLPLLGVTGAREMWASWFAHAGLAYATPPLHRFDSFVAALAAAEAGAGILLGSRPLIDRHLENGRLHALSSCELAGESGHFLTWPADMSVSGARADLIAWFGDQTANALPAV